MVHPHRQRGEEGTAEPLLPQEAEEISLVTKSTHKLTDAKSRASCRAVSPPGTATAPPTTAGLSRCITRSKLPALQDTYSTRCHRKAKKTIKDNNHPSHCLFTSLSSRRQGEYRCIKAGTERLKNSFYRKTIRLLNSLH